MSKQPSWRDEVDRDEAFLDSVSVDDDDVFGEPELPVAERERQALAHHVNLRIDGETMSALQELSRRWEKPFSQTLRETIRRGLTAAQEPTSVGWETRSSPSVVFRVHLAGRYFGYFSHTSTGRPAETVEAAT